MNNLDKEFLFLNGKIYGYNEEPFEPEDEDDEPFETYLESKGGFVSVEEKDGDLIYRTADGSIEEAVNIYPRLYEALAADGDIDPVEETEEEKTNVFADPSRRMAIVDERISDYLTRLRENIANNPDFLTR